MSVFHPAISRAWRTWMALAIWPACQGHERSLCRVAQVLSWALARSWGAQLGVGGVGGFLGGGLVLAR